MAIPIFKEFTAVKPLGVQEQTLQLNDEVHTDSIHQLLHHLPKPTLATQGNIAPEPGVHRATPSNRAGRLRVRRWLERMGVASFAKPH